MDVETGESHADAPAAGTWASASVPVRNEPVQARAAQRIEALLDAAAAVVESHGIEHLTTALVAERAGASIGTVYRYFPDRVAVLVALAARNQERVRLAIERVTLVEHETWLHAIDAMIDAMVEVCRTEPSFRTVRAGESLDLGPSTAEPTTRGINDDVERYLTQRWGLPFDDARREHLELSIGAVDAFVSYAFLRDRDGDERYIALAHECARKHLFEAWDDPTAAAAA